jgi:hypothetical protein
MNHYIDGTLVESHGREVMDSIKPSNGLLVACAMLGDEQDARGRHRTAAELAFTNFARTTTNLRQAACGGAPRIGASAKNNRVSHVLVAGDVYDSEAPNRKTPMKAQGTLLGQEARRQIGWVGVGVKAFTHINFPESMKCSFR